MHCVTLEWQPAKTLAYVKRGVTAQVFANRTVIALEELLLSIFQSSRVITFCFNSTNCTYVPVVLYDHGIFIQSCINLA